MAFSDEGTGIVEHSRITPVPFAEGGYPKTVEPPDTANPPECQFPEDERPAPELPPYSCRNTAAEPPPGTIPTPEPGASKSPEGVDGAWQVLDNALFRFTVAIPAGWYSNMRPEGGSFRVSDPAVLEEDQKGIDVSGGVVLIFTARDYVPPRDSDGLQPDTEIRLNTPNFDFGGYPGVVWDDAPDEGLARVIRAAFAKDGVVYEVRIQIAGGRSAAEVDADAEMADEILRSITPY
jgi:hypothetical protein